MTLLARFFPYLLLAIHSILLLWGIAGFIEYMLPRVPFHLQNANFPPGTQLLHWLLLMASGSVFTVGFLTRFKHTPIATTTSYAMLATLCFIETVDFNAFGTTPARYIPMTLEFITYIALSAYLAKSSTIANRFRHTNPADI